MEILEVRHLPTRFEVVQFTGGVENAKEIFEWAADRTNPHGEKIWQGPRWEVYGNDKETVNEAPEYIEWKGVFIAPINFWIMKIPNEENPYWTTFRVFPTDEELGREFINVTGMV